MAWGGVGISAAKFTPSGFEKMAARSRGWPRSTKESTRVDTGSPSRAMPSKTSARRPGSPVGVVKGVDRAAAFRLGIPG